MKLTKEIKILVFSLLMALLPFAGYGQIRINSPYSAYGLGDVNLNENGISRSMGGIAIGLQSPDFINTKNPASFGSLDSGTFLLDAGYSGLLLQNKSDQSTQRTNYFNLDYLKVAFPITNWWRTSLNLSPYTTVGYDVKTTGTVDSIGQVEYSYLGDGGISRFSWGNAFKIGRHFQMGFNTSFLFGRLNYRRLSHIPNHPTFYDFRITHTLDIRSIYFDYGLQYIAEFGKEDKELKQKPFDITVGLIFSNQQKLNGVLSSFGETFLSTESGYEYIKDTLINGENAKGIITVPLYYGGGFYLRKKGRWGFGADVTWQNWANFSSFESTDTFSNSLSVNVGGSYYWNRVIIRSGLRYYKTYLTLRGEQINRYGITFGASIPLRWSSRAEAGTWSYLDLGIEAGQKGTTKTGLVRQDYLRVFLGVTIKNVWFNKLKYF